MLVGISIFLLWFITRKEIFFWMGFYGLFACLASVAVSSVFLMVSLGDNRVHGRQLVFSVLPAVFLMVLNFPVGIAVIIAFDYFQSQYVLIVKNDSSVVVKDIRIVATSEDVIGDLCPNEQTTKKYHFAGDGNLTFSASIEGQTINGAIEGYVTQGIGGKKQLIFGQDLQYRLVDERK